MIDEKEAKERIREHVRQILKRLRDRERSKETRPAGEGQDRRS
jgi:hypothetical protein